MRGALLVLTSLASVGVAVNTVPLGWQCESYLTLLSNACHQTLTNYSRLPGGVRDAVHLFKVFL